MSDGFPQNGVSALTEIGQALSHIARAMEKANRLEELHLGIISSEEYLNPPSNSSPPKPPGKFGAYLKGDL